MNQVEKGKNWTKNLDKWQDEKNICNLDKEIISLCYKEPCIYQWEKEQWLQKNNEQKIVEGKTDVYIYW